MDISPKKPIRRQLGMVGTGTTLAVAMAFFPMLGYYLGHKYDRLVLGILSGVFLGLFFCAYEVWKVTRTPPPDDSK